MPGWMKHNLESRLLGEISVTSDMNDDTTLMAESKELKSLLMKVKEENEKAGLKLNIQKMKIMASGPIISWKTDGETMETVTDFIFLAPKSLWMVTTAMKLKETKSCLVKAMVFPVVMYGCERWTTKKAERRRIDAFQLLCS